MRLVSGTVEDYIQPDGEKERRGMQQPHQQQQKPPTPPPPGAREERLIDDQNRDIVIRFAGEPTYSTYEFLADYIALRMKRMKAAKQTDDEKSN